MFGLEQMSYAYKYMVDYQLELGLFTFNNSYVYTPQGVYS